MAPPTTTPNPQLIAEPGNSGRYGGSARECGAGRWSRPGVARCNDRIRTQGGRDSHRTHRARRSWRRDTGRTAISLTRRCPLARAISVIDGPPPFALCDGGIAKLLHFQLQSARPNNRTPRNKTCFSAPQKQPQRFHTEHIVSKVFFRRTEHSRVTQIRIAIAKQRHKIRHTTKRETASPSCNAQAGPVPPAPRRAGAPRREALAPGGERLKHTGCFRNFPKD